MSSVTAQFTDSYQEDIRTIIIKIPKRLMVEVDLSKLDYAVFDDIEHNDNSKTPIADQLLGLETLIRRIEEQGL